jgi:hypothetical protein
MTSQARYEYHWLRSQVVQVVANRPLGVKRWRYPKRPQSSLIATFERDGPSFQFRPGPAFDDDRLAEAAIMFRHGDAIKSKNDLGRFVPEKLARELAKQLESKSNELPIKFDSFAVEPDMSAHLVGLWTGHSVTDGDWSIRTSAVTFNSVTKEPHFHADIGVVFIVAFRGVRTMKALWIQAKRNDELPTLVNDLPDLDLQIREMLRHSKESYAAVYTRRKVHLFEGTNFDDDLTVTEVFFDGIVCQRADPNPRFVAVASDSKFIIDVIVSGPGPVAPVSGKN